MSMMQIRNDSLGGQYIGEGSNISYRKNVGETASNYPEQAVRQDTGNEPESKGYGEEATLEISEEAYRKLAEQSAKSIQEQLAAGLNSESELALPMGGQPQHTYYIIGDYDLDDKLRQALNAAPNREAKEALDTAAWNIVSNYLMPQNIGNKTEQERLSLIEDGLKEAENLLEGLDKDAAAALMDFMEGVAKYGRAGKVGEDGSVTYDVKNPGWRKVYGQGNAEERAGVPELALETMAREAPEEFQKMMELYHKGFNSQGEEGSGLLLQASAIYLKWAWGSPKAAYYEKQKRDAEQAEETKDDADKAKEKDIGANKQLEAAQKWFEEIQAQQVELQQDLYLMKSLGESENAD